MFSIVSTEVKLKLIEITFCWLIVAFSRVKEGRLMARVALSRICGIDASWRGAAGEVPWLLWDVAAEESFYFEAVLEDCAQ